MSPEIRLVLACLIALVGVTWILIHAIGEEFERKYRAIKREHETELNEQERR